MNTQEDNEFLLKDLYFFNKYKNEEIHSIEVGRNFKIFYFLYMDERGYLGFEFCVVEWYSQISDYDGTHSWDEEKTEVQLFMTGTALFDGIRHMHLENSYFFYPDMEELSALINTLKVMESNFTRINED